MFHPQRYHPLRYEYTESTLEVHLKSQEQAVRPVSNAYLLDGSIHHHNQLYERLCAAQEEGNMAEVQDCIEAMKTRFPVLLGHENDKVDIMVGKIQELVMYPVPREFYVVYHRELLAKSFLQMHLLCQCMSHHVDDDNNNSCSSQPPQHQTESISSNGTLLGDDARPNACSQRNLHSNHEGYKVEDTDMLCKNFGEYLFLVLLHLRFGAVLAGIVVPPSRAATFHQRILTQIPILKSRHPSWYNCWSSTIDFVVKYCADSAETLALAGDASVIDLPEPLSGEEYERFQAILELLDTKGVYGNLKREFCSLTGHLKWVCNDIEESMANGRQLLDSLEELVARTDSATLDRKKRELSFTLLNSARAMQSLYQAFGVSPGIAKVVVNLGSSPSDTIFHSFRKTLEEANMADITLDGRNLTNPGPLCNHVLKLMTRRCQSLQLLGFKEFYAHIAKATNIKPTKRLYVLDIECPIQMDNQFSSLLSLLRLCPCLKRLTIRCAYSERHQRDILQLIPDLESLEMVGPVSTIIVRFTKVEDGNTAFEVEAKGRDHRLPIFDSVIVPNLTILRVECARGPDHLFKSWFLNQLRSCLQLHTVDFEVPLELFGEMFDYLKESFRTRTGPSAGKQAVVRLVPNSKHEHKVEMIARFQGPNILDIDIDVTMTGNKNSNPFLRTIFREHGSSIRTLGANEFLDDQLLETLLATVEVKGSKLQKLALDPSGLHDTYRIQNLISHAPATLDFTLSLSNLQSASQQQHAITIKDQCGEFVTNLILHGRGGADWLRGLGLTRHILRKLQHLEIAFENAGEVNSHTLDTIISPPGHDKRPIQHLKSFSLSECFLSPGDWERVLSMVDLQELETLSFEETNFGEDQMRLLIRRLPKPVVNPRQRQQQRPTVTPATVTIPFHELCIRGTAFAGPEQKAIREPLETLLIQRVPNLRVIK